MFDEANLESFIKNTRGEIYLTLVRVFFTNLKYAYGITTFEIQKHQIYLSLEEFVEICNLSCTIFLYNELEPG